MAVCKCGIMVVSILAASISWAQEADTILATPKISTTPVIFDADDPAIWIHPTDPGKSLILGTDKGTYPDGGLFVWNLDGSLQQRENISHPNHVDVRYGMRLGNSEVDVAVVSMRDHRQIRVFAIDSVSRTLTHITTEAGINIFKSPFGLALYRRPRDGAMFAFVSSAHNQYKKKIWQLRLEQDSTGFVSGTLVREFGQHSEDVEGMVADDELGYVYLAEQKVGIHKFYADPDSGNERLAFFAPAQEFSGNREGMAVYKCGDSTGYLLVANPANKTIRIYRREGEEGDPHRHVLLRVVKNTLRDEGDGIEVTSQALSPLFPHGLVVWHNQDERLFQLYAWEDFAQNELAICAATQIPTGIESRLPDGGPQGMELLPNHPNPFNPETVIQFHLAEAEIIELGIYNLLGEKVKSLRLGPTGSGFHQVTWDGRDDLGLPVASGIYLCRLKSQNITINRKMTLLR